MRILNEISTVDRAGRNALELLELQQFHRRYFSDPRSNREQPLNQDWIIYHGLD